MAPIEKKRVREAAHDLPRKRKTGNQVNQASSSRDKEAHSVSLDLLPWHQVPFPETFQDAEGFFSLEELSDVEVSKAAGKVEYKLSSTKPHPVRANKARVPRYENSAPSRQDDALDGNGEEWEGLEESDLGQKEADRPPLPGADPRIKKELDKVKDRRKTADKQPDTNKSSGPSRQADNANQFLPLGKNHEEADLDEECDVSAWGSLNLCSETLSSLARSKFSYPTAIQSSALPHLLAGHDAICKAPTGSGKTLTFGIPIYEQFIATQKAKIQQSTQADRSQDHFPIALVLSPTRELAHQLSDHLNALGSVSSSRSPSIVTLTGGLSIQKQQRLLASADIVIGTPGRLWEVIQSDSDFSKTLRMIKFLVLDEADRLLSSGHFAELEEILNALDRSDVNDDEDDNSDEESSSTSKRQRQTLVFSATFQKDLQQKLAGRSKATPSDPSKHQSMEYLLKRLKFREAKPKFIDVNPISQMAAGLKEGIVECAGMEKDLYLYSLLLHYPQARTLVFTNSITSVRRLTLLLQNLALPAHALHSQMPMKARLHAIERFASPTSTILVATDVAARGLDIPSVELVVHYHVPRSADMYVHRSGRTARAEKSGSSILLCAPEETQGVRRLIAKVHVQDATHEADSSKRLYLETIQLDRRVVTRLKPRIALSRKITEASLAKEKHKNEDDWLKSAAEELGVDYDSNEFAVGEGSKKGRGQGKKKREKEARSLTKDALGSLKAELKGLLAQRVNLGVSERYLTSGMVDIDGLLNEQKKGEFLGKIDDIHAHV